MFSVSRDLFEVLSLVSRYLFVLLVLMLVFRGLAALLAAARQRSDQIRNLPGTGYVGELVVVSGNGELRSETWFPVPKEGVLGSVRSCDLYVPCRGIRKHHLDFSWQEGTGLLLHPRSGCEASVGTVPLDCRSDPRSAPLRHGACLSVGSAVLRFLVFAALAPSEGSDPIVPSGDAAARVPVSFDGKPVPIEGALPPFPAPTAGSEPVPFGSPGQPYPAPVPGSEAVPFGSPAPSFPGQVPGSEPASFGSPAPAPGSEPVPFENPMPPSPAEPRRRRSDRWKEDWSD